MLREQAQLQVEVRPLGRRGGQAVLAGQDEGRFTASLWRCALLQKSVRNGNRHPRRTVHAAELRRRAVTAPIAARPQPVKGGAPRSDRNDRPTPGVSQQRFKPLTQYTDTAAPTHDPSGAHPTATRARPTIDDDAHTIMINRVAWGAIFAGVVVALVVQVLLTMLGVGIGMATLDPAAATTPPRRPSRSPPPSGGSSQASSPRSPAATSPRGCPAALCRPPAPSTA